MGRARLQTSSSYVASLPKLDRERDGTISQGVFTRITEGITSIISKVNGYISFGGASDGEWAGDIDGQFRTEVITPAAANSQFIVEHGLGRTPVHFFPTCDRAAIVYADAADRASWSPTRIYLKCNIVSAKIYLLIV